MEDYIITPKYAFIEVTTPSTLPTSYIDPSDLYEVLKLYYENQLDQVELNPETFYRPAEEWYSNSLIGLLSSYEIRQYLFSLNKLERSTIEHHFKSDPKLREDIYHSYYHSQVQVGFQEYLLDCFNKAFFNLADKIYQAL